MVTTSIEHSVLDGSTHRIVIREVEPLSTDAPPPAAHPELVQRSIFLDIIPMP